jgi:hypothetical protein
MISPGERITASGEWIECGGDHGSRCGHVNFWRIPEVPPAMIDGRSWFKSGLWQVIQRVFRVHEVTASQAQA